MNTSGDAAEQVVRLSLEGVEVAAKITGSAAKEVAALLYAALKNRDKHKIKGRQRLTSMLKSGKELSIFSVKNEDMKRFVSEAKRYGVVYCALRNPKNNPGGECEIMVRAEDAAKINRIVENIKIATVFDPEAIKEEVENGKTKNTSKTSPEKDIPEKSADDLLVEDMLKKPVQKTETTHENPSAAKTKSARPSEPSLKRRSRSAEGTVKRDNRPSVRKELNEIRRQQKAKDTKPANREDRPTQNKSPKPRYNNHRQPDNKKKVKNTKER